MQNERLLIQYASLGWDFIKSQVNKDIFVKKIPSELEKMYEHGLARTTVAKLNAGIVEDLNGISEGYAKHPSGKVIIAKLNKYGAKVYRQATTLDDVCER